MHSPAGPTLRTRERALGTMTRAEKGPIAPPPVLHGPAQVVANAIAGWSGVSVTTHWHLYRRSEVDGIDFYVGVEELGHIHLDGSIHLATSPTLGATLVEAGLARRFRHVRGWTEELIDRIGTEAAVALFRRNYDWIVDTQDTVLGR